jgi:hypothetical protein
VTATTLLTPEKRSEGAGNPDIPVPEDAAPPHSWFLKCGGAVG